MKVAILASSNRKEASSTKLLLYIKKKLEEKGCTVTFFDLYKQPVPFYCPDIEDYEDTNLIQLKKYFLEADAIVLGTAEYHGSMTGVLKNALDHLGGEHFDGKPVLSVSSSGGAVAVSSLQHIQSVVRNVHGLNCPEWISIGGENRKFTLAGEPVNPMVEQRVGRALDYFISMTRKLSV